MLIVFLTALSFPSRGIIILCAGDSLTDSEYPGKDVRVDSDHTSVDAFAGKMRAIIGLFREFTDRRGEKARILLATIPPLPARHSAPFGPESAGRVVKEINPLIRKIAAEERLVLVDNYAIFLRSPELLPDVHPTSAGYRLLVRNWHEALKPLRPGIEVRPRK